MIWAAGNETVGIVTYVPALDGSGNPVLSELMETQTTEQVISKTGCAFEIQLAATTFVKQAEDVTATTTTAKQVAWAFLPPDSDTTALKLGQSLRYPYPGGNDYELRMVVVENNMAGVADHVFCLCETQEG